jgi:hypothetical protein
MNFPSRWLQQWLAFVRRKLLFLWSKEAQLGRGAGIFYIHFFFQNADVTRSFVVCVCFVGRCLSFCTFSFCYCVVWFSSIYAFGIPLWCLQTLQLFCFYFCFYFCFWFLVFCLALSRKSWFLGYVLVLSHSRHTTPTVICFGRTLSVTYTTNSTSVNYTFISDLQHEQ